MGQGESNRASAVDQLEQLAAAVVARINPNQHDSATRDDCRQAAYLAGMQSRRSAQRAGRPTSSEILELAMRTAVYRLLRQPAGRAQREADFAFA